MKSEERAYALDLANDLLGDIELDRLPLDKLLLKGARLARLVADEDFSEWTAKEIHGYRRADFGGKHWTASMRGSDRDSGTYAGATHLSAYVETLESELANLKIPNVSGDGAIIAIRETRNHIAGVRNKVMESGVVLTTVRNVLHQYCVKHYHLLRFSVHQGEMFEVAKSSIDNILTGLSSTALRKIDSAYANITAGDPESIAGAMNSIRRLIDEVADALFPAISETRLDGQGKEVKLGEQNRLNRIKAYVDDHAKSKRRGDRLKRSVTDIYSRVSSGVHSDVAASEATYLFLSTYVLLGDIASLSVDGD
ncbi:AbiTii domain-containing protein [Streptomyces cacaoi]|uniref:AbiTii domain-containing protein n=1 Tax=Streptomyces cacaoi TaxID=1898 RepID=UPI00332993C3